MLFPTMDMPRPDSNADELHAVRGALADRYAIEREVGRGGMSIVYLAHDRKHDRPVALKFLRPELAEAVGRERFLREIRIAASLHHPAILPLFDSGEAAGRLYYVMPYVEGESLRARLGRETQMPLDEALQIAREVAEGLSHAHAHGIVHRDIKPENILLTGGHAAIADFGIARAVTAAAGGRLTDSGIAVGTPAYMSPEQATGEDHIDGRSDLWSLGCVLYEMLAGEPPFTGPTSHAILARILHDPMPPLRTVRSSVAPQLERTVERALAKIPADRFATASEFIAALSSASTLSPPTARRRVRVGLVVAIGGSLVAGTALIAVLLGRVRDRPADPGAPDPTRIAVLYFQDLSEGGRLQHIARGLTENLIDELSGVGALRVISPGGVRPYSTGSWPLDSIVTALGVGTIVEGSVERVRDSLRVHVRLIDGATQEQLQSELVGRPLGDLFALQRDIAEEVARFLRARLGVEVRVRERRAATHSVAAWELVQRGVQAVEDAQRLERRGYLHAASGMLYHADSLFAEATAYDARWTEPVVQRGWVAVGQGRLVEAAASGAGVTESVRAPAMALPETTWVQRAFVHAERALELRTDDPRALHLRGYVSFWMWTLSGSDPEQATVLADAERDLRRAVAVDPGFAGAWNTLGLVLYQRGEFAEAALVLERALDADAYLREAAANMQLLLFAALEEGDAEAADEWCRRGRTRFPDDARFAECDLIVVGWTGATAAAVTRAWRMLRDIETRDSVGRLTDTWAFRRTMVAAVLARAGLADSALRVLHAMRTTAPRASTLRGIDLYEAYVFTLLGDHDRAVESLATYLRAAPGHRGYVASTRWFHPLRSDARFQRLVAHAEPETPGASPGSP